MSGHGASSVAVHGSVSPGFEEVRDEFARNFAERGELGAACAAYWRGEKVVDLWGGIRDQSSGTPWEEDTLVMPFSTTKGVASLAMAVAHSRGLIDPAERVAAYWPQFAQGGKDGVTVRQLLAHQAGLCAIGEPLTIATLADPDAVAAAIARQTPAWKPGTRHGYHLSSLGFYESELLRRVDPGHRTLGRFFHEEIAEPLGLEFWIGLPENVPDGRVARIELASPPGRLVHLNTMPLRLVLAAMAPWTIAYRSMFNPKVRARDINTRAYWRVEQPSGNGIGTVRSIAKAYGVFAAGGKELDITPQTMALLQDPAPPPAAGMRDVVLTFGTCYGFGYSKPFGRMRFGTGPKAFGTPGLGGSFGFADPDAQAGWAYVPNKHGYFMEDDPREKAPRHAFYRCLAAHKRGTSPAGT